MSDNRMSNHRTLSPLELALVRRLLEVTESRFIPKREKIVMTLVATNDSMVLLKPIAEDRDGVAIPAAGLQVTVDKPDVAAVTADPNTPGQFIVRPLAATDPNAGSRTVIVTTTDPATGASVETPIQFDPGGEASLVVNTEIVPLADGQAAAAAQSGDSSAQSGDGAAQNGTAALGGDQGGPDLSKPVAGAAEPGA